MTNRIDNDNESESTISDINPNCYHNENFLDVDTPGRFKRTNYKKNSEKLKKKIKLKIKLTLTKISTLIKFTNKTSRNCETKFLGTNFNSNKFNDFLDEN